MEWRRVLNRCFALAWPAALVIPLTAVSAETIRIFPVPPTRWDNSMSRDQPAQLLGPSDLANLTGGIVFGLSPAEVNAKLPAPMPGVEWIDLPFASEYPDEVRYFWVRLDAVRQTLAGNTACAGAGSYVVFLFRDRGLFRISWRLLPDEQCASTRAAAQEIYARYLAIDGSAALASHYLAGKAEVVEVTDPRVDYLVPYRWANRQRR
jgi:hypothetical protein